jgi:alpha-galactosidase
MKNLLPLYSLLTFFILFFVSETYAQNLKVFILAGQSNMQGHGDIEPENTNGTLSYFIENSEDAATFSYLQDDDGNWATREDVWVRYDHEDGNLRLGNLGVGYGAWEGQIGPELGFGHRIGNYLNDQVLIIKTCWGGTNLAQDFRPPSAGGTTGPYFNQMISDINTAIVNIAEEFPDYANEEIEIAGLCWFQGWNDGEEDAFLEEYEQNLIHLIADVRNELALPDLPVVVGLTGIGGYELIPDDFWVQQLQSILVPAQINAANYDGHTNVCYAETRGFFIDEDLSPASAIHHWNNNAESYLKIGNELALKMIEKLDLVSSTPQYTLQEKLTVYPNPSSDYIIIAGANDLYEVQICDHLGNVVLFIAEQPKSEKINISSLKAGSYFAQIKSLKSGISVLKRLVKTNAPQSN